MIKYQELLNCCSWYSYAFLNLIIFFPISWLWNFQKLYQHVMWSNLIWLVWIMFFLLSMQVILELPMNCNNLSLKFPCIWFVLISHRKISTGDSALSSSAALRRWAGSCTIVIITWKEKKWVSHACILLFFSIIST